MTTYDREEPGFDLHEWTSVKASIEEDIADDPDAGLSQLADLVRRMLLDRGYAVDDPVASQGEEVEIVVSYRAARETTERAELGDASRSEVENAIDELREVFASLVADAGID
jgi:hypothetical protein